MWHAPERAWRDSPVPDPPEYIRRAAHVAGNGELLWPRRGAGEAVRWMAANQMGIWGGEVYSPRGPFTAVMVNEWRTEPQQGSEEPWSSYVARGLVQALEAIDSYPTSEHGDRQPDQADELLYFLAYHSQAGFPEDRESRVHVKTVEGF